MKKIYIEISDICGLSCSFCPTLKNMRGVMPLELFSHCLDESLRFSKTIALHILGDPCRIHNLADYLAIARQKGAKVELVTSGAYLKWHNFSLLVSPPIKQIAISLEAGFDPNNHIKNYLGLVCEFALFHKQNPQCFLNLRIQDERLLRDRWQLERICYALGIQDYQEIFTQRRIRLWKRAFLVVKKSFVWALFAPYQNLESKKCYGLKEQIGILSNGVVVPCCIDSSGVINLGNIKNQSLKNILTSKRAMAIKRGFQNNQAIEKICQKCTYPAINNYYYL